MDDKYNISHDCEGHELNFRRLLFCVNAKLTTQTDFD